jgi:uncharacterized protein
MENLCAGSRRYRRGFCASARTCTKRRKIDRRQSLVFHDPTLADIIAKLRPWISARPLLMQKRTLLSLAVLLAILAGVYFGRAHLASPPSAIGIDVATLKQPAPAAPRYMFNVSLHTAEELRRMLARAEELAARGPASQSETGIALVLHGPEINLFTKQNYASNKMLVDLAERLDRNGVIEITMCQTAMRALGVTETDVPPFISFVPYAPEEIKRLQADGYVYL